MTGNIYVIKNTINNKVYIGKTFNTVHCRFKEHIRESRKQRSENRKLYKAIKKYGEENFFIESLEENVEEDILCSKEIYYIELYDAFNNGYNTTLGGEGKRLITIPDEDVLQEYRESRSMRHTAKKLGISEDSIMQILHNNNAEIFKPNAKRIKIIDLDLEFPTIKDCEKYLYNNNYTSATCRGSISTNIKRSIKRNGKYLGLKFEILD